MKSVQDNKAEINSIKLDDGNIISVGDIIIEKDTNFYHSPFRVKGIFICTQGFYCFYKENLGNKMYAGNSDNVNNYKLYETIQL